MVGRFSAFDTIMLVLEANHNERFRCYDMNIEIPVYMQINFSLIYNFNEPCTEEPEPRYKIAHLLGKPHGPSLSFSSFAGAAGVARAAPFSLFALWVSFAADVPFPFTSVFAPASHAKLNFETVSPNC